ncbi:MAG: DUF1499 domain-containing protein [Verrucomicrobiales bacterium]|nr:DUF1499 domain-containing protein [Verrucomicrobiales bacterium]
MNWRRRIPVVVVPLIVAGCIASRMAPPVRSSTPDSPLAPCPATPNCVCSEDPDPRHRIPPLPFTGAPSDAMAQLRKVVGALPRTTVISAGDTHLQVEFRTPVFRFVDDVEFRMDAPNHVIQVRSGSRIGYSDLGTNRRRVDRIRAELAALGIPAP